MAYNMGGIKMNALERFYLKHGPGLNCRFLEALRAIAKITGLEERKLSSGGYSYFPPGAKKRGRVLKIAKVGNQLYIEFNSRIDTDIDIKDIVFLSDEMRRDLHAGGVEFCYVGSNFNEAEDLIKLVI